MQTRTIDIDEFSINKYIESKRPEDLEIRKQLDFGYAYINHVFELFEIRPVWNNPKEIQNIPFAKIRYYKSKQLWHLYWQRANGKWELYEPFPTSSHLSKIIEVIDADNNGCFYG